MKTYEYAKTEEKIKLRRKYQFMFLWIILRREKQNYFHEEINILLH
jgi:hypothetical protein